MSTSIYGLSTEFPVNELARLHRQLDRLATTDPEFVRAIADIANRVSGVIVPRKGRKGALITYTEKTGR